MHTFAIVMVAVCAVAAPASVFVGHFYAQDSAACYISAAAFAINGWTFYMNAALPHS